MIRSALIICAGIIIATCFACMPAPQPSGGQPPLVRSGTSTGTGTGNVGCSATDFADAVMMLPANYTPDPTNPPTGAFPTVYQGPGSSSPIVTDLANAFTAAPQKLRSKLCVTTVFINPTCSSPACVGSNSWGMRYPNNINQRYIALSQGLWPNPGQSAEIYSQYETNLIAQVLAQLPGTPAPWPTSSGVPNPPTFEMQGIGTYNTSAMAVLAVLAHEFGHILWYDLAKGAGNNNNYVAADLCRSHPGVPGDGFFDNSWYSITNPDTFQGFDASKGDQHLLANIQTTDLVNAINGKSWLTAVNDLTAYYSTDTNSRNPNPNGIWGSLFGSISPEEDFVEAFKIYIMTRPDTNGRVPVTSLPLDLFATPSTSTVATPTQKPDLYADIAQLKKKELKSKFDCIDGKW